MRTLLPKIFLVLFIFAFGSTAFAQPPKKALERIRLIKKLKLIEILDLDEETSIKVIKIYDEWEDKIEKQQELVDEAAHDLEKSLKKDESVDIIKKKTEKYQELQKKLHDTIYEKFTAMKKVLDARQYAKFLVFEHYFKMELLKLMRKHREGGPPPGRGERHR